MSVVLLDPQSSVSTASDSTAIVSAGADSFYLAVVGRDLNEAVGRTGVTAGGGQWVDNLEILRTDKYYQKGWARVELVNSANETEMVMPVIQPYLTWSTGEITLKLYKELNSDFIGKSLVIYDDNDTVIASALLSSSTVTAELV